MFHGMAHWSLENIQHTFYAFLHPLRLLRLMCQGVRRCQEPGLVRFSKNFFVVSTSTCPSEWQIPASWTNRMLPLTVWKGFKSNLRKSKSRPKPDSYYTKYNFILIMYRVTHSNIHSTLNIYLNNPEYIYIYSLHMYMLYISIYYIWSLYAIMYGCVVFHSLSASDLTILQNWMHVAVQVELTLLSDSPKISKVAHVWFLTTDLIWLIALPANAKYKHGLTVMSFLETHFLMLKPTFVS